MAFADIDFEQFIEDFRKLKDPLEYVPLCIKYDIEPEHYLDARSALIGLLKYYQYVTKVKLREYEFHDIINDRMVEIYKKDYNKAKGIVEEEKPVEHLPQFQNGPDPGASTEEKTEKASE